MTIAIIVILSASRTIVDSMTSSIVVSSTWIVSCTVAGWTCKRITVALGREVVPIRCVRHRANMTLYVSTITAGVTTYRCGVVVDSTGNIVRNFGNSVRNFGNAIRNSWYIVSYAWWTIRVQRSGNCCQLWIWELCKTRCCYCHEGDDWKN